MARPAGSFGWVARPWKAQEFLLIVRGHNQMKRDQPKTHFRNGSLSHAIMQMQTPQSSDSYLRARSTFVKFKFQGHMGLFDTYRIELESPRPVANPTEPSPLYLYGRGNLFRQNEFVVLTSSSTNSCQPVAKLRAAIQWLVLEAIEVYRSWLGLATSKGQHMHGYGLLDRKRHGSHRIRTRGLMVLCGILPCPWLEYNS